MAPTQLLRALLGGALMGLANLVPGVSGATMLLAAGVYRGCLDALAKVASLRFDRDSVRLLATVGGTAALAALLLAGELKDMLASEDPWFAYSLFLGATLGGAPPLWKLIGKPDARVWTGALAGLAAAAGLPELLPESASSSSGAPAPLLALAGFAACAAMLLPGLSGATVLLLSGQYATVLGAVEGAQTALLSAASPDRAPLVEAWRVLAPFAVGAFAALVGASNLIRRALRSPHPATLGALLGALLGSARPLWPLAPLTFPHSPLYPWVRVLGSLGTALWGFFVTCWGAEYVLEGEHDDHSVRPRL